MRVAEAGYGLNPDRNRERLVKANADRERPFSVSLEEARAIILDSVSPLNLEYVSLADAANRVLYEDIVSEGHDAAPGRFRHGPAMP